MANKERYQNPVGGDTIILRLFVYNSNNLADPHELGDIDIYYLDPNEVSEDNPDGRCFVTTISSDNIVRECTGTYYTELVLDRDIYPIGKYLDVWKLTLTSITSETPIENCFQVYSQLWYTTPIPVVYDFSFHFQPNKIRYGTKKYIRIEIVPEVPRATDLAVYYENLAIVSDLSVSIEKACCPQDSFSDLNLVVDDQCVDFREKRFGFFFLDTETMDLDCGLYNVWFKLKIGGNTYVSDKQQLQIFS